MATEEEKIDVTVPENDVTIKKNKKKEKNVV